MNKIAFLLFASLCLFFLSCTSLPESKTDKLKTAYKEGVITLQPPLSQYRGLQLKLDRKLVNNEALSGIRVHLNTPFSPVRKVGESPSAITYFFSNGKSILFGLDRQGNVTVQIRAVGQSTEGVDTNIQELRALANKEG